MTRKIGKTKVMIIEGLFLFFTLILGIAALILSSINISSTNSAPIFDPKTNLIDNLYLCGDEVGTMNEQSCFETRQVVYGRYFQGGKVGELLQITMAVDIASIVGFLVSILSQVAIFIMIAAYHCLQKTPSKKTESLLACTRMLDFGCFQLELVFILAAVIINCITLAYAFGNMPSEADVRMRYYWSSKLSTTGQFNATFDYANNPTFGGLTTKKSDPIDRNICRHEGGYCDPLGTIGCCDGGVCGAVTPNVCSETYSSTHFEPQRRNLENSAPEDDYYSYVIQLSHQMTTSVANIYGDSQGKHRGPRDYAFGTITGSVDPTRSLAYGQPANSYEFPNMTMLTTYNDTPDEAGCVNYYWKFYRPGGFLNGTKVNPGVVDSSLIMQNCRESKLLYDELVNQLQGNAAQAAYQIPLMVVSFLLSMANNLIWNNHTARCPCVFLFLMIPVRQFRGAQDKTREHMKKTELLCCVFEEEE